MLQTEPVLHLKRIHLTRISKFQPIRLRLEILPSPVSRGRIMNRERAAYSSNSEHRCGLARSSHLVNALTSIENIVWFFFLLVSFLFSYLANKKKEKYKEKKYLYFSLLLSRDKQQFCIMQQTCSFFAKYSSFCSFARSLCFVKEEILTLFLYLWIKLIKDYSKTH